MKNQICFFLLLSISSSLFAGAEEILAKNINTASPLEQKTDSAKAKPNLNTQTHSEDFELQLISPYSQVKKGTDFLVGLHIKIPKDWHSYWSFAGDFGQAPTVQWEKMDPIQIQSLPFPAPERKSFLINKKPSYSFIYEKELLIPFKVSIDKNYDKTFLPLSLSLKWFICKDICLSKENSLSLHLKLDETFKENPVSKKTFDFWEPFFPKKLDLKSHFQVRDDKLFIHLYFEEKIKCLDIFPKRKEDFSTALPSLLNQGPNSCAFQVEKSSSELSKISALFVYSKQGKKHSTLFQSDKKEKFSLLWFIFLAFLGGLILNVMPCVLPIIFLKFYNTLELRHLPARKILFLNLSYSLGVIVSFLCLAFFIFISKQTGESLGWGFHLQSPVFVTFLSLLFILMAFYLLNVIAFSTPRVSLFFKDERLIPHFMTGILSTTAASPCTVPFMVSAVGFAFSRSVTEIFIIFFFLGLGLSSPYIVLSFFPKALRYIPSPGRWTELLKKFLAIPLFLTALWLFRILYLQVDIKIFLLSLGAFPLLLLWLFFQKIIQKTELKKRIHIIFICMAVVFFSGQKFLHNFLEKNDVAKQSRKTLPRDLNWINFNKDKISFDKQSGKQIFVAFGAEWCLTCKLNERVFETQEFKKLIKDNSIVLYYGDWTVRDKEITDFLQSYGQQGVPFYVFFKAEEKVFVFPTLLFKESFFQKIKEFSQ